MKRDQTHIDLHVRKGWLFWQAIRLDEPVGEFDAPTVYRSRTRQGAIDKARRVSFPRWERVRVLAEEPK